MNLREKDGDQEYEPAPGRSILPGREDLMLVSFFPHSSSKCSLASTMSKEVCGARKDTLSRGSALRNLRVSQRKKNITAMQVLLGK